MSTDEYEGIPCKSSEIITLSGTDGKHVLLLGDKGIARDRDVLKKLGVHHILNVTPTRVQDPVAGVPNYFEKVPTGRAAGGVAGAPRAHSRLCPQSSPSTRSAGKGVPVLALLHL